MQATFLAAIPASGASKRLSVIACSTVTRNLVNTATAVRWLGLMVSAPTFNLAFWPLIVLLLAYLLKHQSSAGFPETLYLDLLKRFVSSVLGSRERPDDVIIERCAILFKKVTHALFKDLLLPAMRKALLRSPDELVASEYKY